MATPEDPSVFDEPQFHADAAQPDPTEQRAAETLRRQHQRDPEADLNQSVFDEPNIFPHRDHAPIDQDWTCSHCGYNLRGLRTGDRCPECGHIELYTPSPPEAPSYQSWLRFHMAMMTPSRGWKVSIMVALLGGVWAVLAASSDAYAPAMVTRTGILLVVVFGPTMEESLKVGAALLIVEARPYVFQRSEQIWFATLGTALGFAIIENILYLNLYIPNPSVPLVIWRWTACVALHMGCTYVATRGLVRVWKQAITELRAPRLSLGMPALVTAIVLHACYSAAVAFYSFAR